MNKRRGRNAAKSGAYGENVFLGLLEAAGIGVEQHWKQYDGSTPTAVYQYPVPHPYRPDKARAGKNDCMLFTGAKEVYCQVKNQNGSGTTDEKLSFSFDIARYALADHAFDLYALILLGPWWPEKPGIIEWAKRKCKEFEMLAAGKRYPTEACVVVGPIETARWIQSLPVVHKSTGLFND